MFFPKGAFTYHVFLCLKFGSGQLKASHLGCSFDTYKSKLHTGQCSPSCSYIGGSSWTSRLSNPWWFFSSSLNPNDMYTFPLQSVFLTKLVFYSLRNPSRPRWQKCKLISTTILFKSVSRVSVPNTPEEYSFLKSSSQIADLCTVLSKTLLLQGAKNSIKKLVGWLEFYIMHQVDFTVEWWRNQMTDACKDIHKRTSFIRLPSLLPQVYIKSPQLADQDWSLFPLETRIEAMVW